MASIEDTPLWVDGTLTAGNIKAGRIYCAPVTSGNQIGESGTLTLTGTGNLFVQVTGHSDHPACRTQDERVRQVSIHEVGPNSFQVRVHRSDPNASGTWVFYLATRNP